MSQRSITIKDVARIKRENEKLAQIEDCLRQENCELAFKCNHMENILTNIQALIKDSPSELVQATQNLYSLLQTSNVAQGTTQFPNNNNSPDKSRSVKLKHTPGKPRHSNNEYVAVTKPHRVNGHVLFIPTVTLTRVPDSYVNNHSKHHNTNDDSLEENSSGEAQSSGDNAEIESENESQEFTNDHQISHLEDISEASASQSPHSTVLSGTFQEVKIYLNQISQDSINESSRKRQRTRAGGTPPKALRTTRNKRR